MPSPVSQWVTKFLKTRGSVLVRLLEMEVYRRCLNCAEEKLHTKHEDQEGNQYHFCKTCGSHN